MKAFLLCFLLIISVGTTGLAQGLDLASILSLLESLKAQVEKLQQSFDQQTFQFGNIQQQFNDFSEKFDASQETIGRIPILEEQVLPLLNQVGEFETILDQIFELDQQLAPLLDQWPAVQEVMQTMTSIQTSFNEQVDMLAGVQQIVRGLTDTTDDVQVEALQTQVTALEQQINETQASETTLREELSNVQLWNWVALGGIAVLLILQIVVMMMRNRQQSAIS